MKLIHCTLFLFCTTFCNAQIENIVFEGAGIRGIAYGGVLKVLEQNNMVKDIRKTGGTSAGAITAVALSIGYRAGEIDSLIYHTNFKKFNDGRNLFLGGTHRLFKKFGWYRGKKFTEWMGKVIAAKTGNADITFEELYQKGYKELYITGTCLNRQELIVFSRHNYPLMSVKDAVRISMSIPLYFEAVWIDKNGRTYAKGGKDLDLMVDGGVLANFPIQMLDTIIENKRIPNMKTIGIRIDSDGQIAADQKDKKLIAYPVLKMKDYAGAFYTILLENSNRISLTDEDWKRTVSVSSKNIGPRIKKLSPHQKELLIKSGEDAMTRFLYKQSQKRASHIDR